MCLERKIVERRLKPGRGLENQTKSLEKEDEVVRTLLYIFHDTPHALPTPLGRGKGVIEAMSYSDLQIRRVVYVRILRQCSCQLDEHAWCFGLKAYTYVD